MNYFVYVFFISFAVDFHGKKINVLGEKATAMKLRSLRVHNFEQ